MPLVWSDDLFATGVPEIDSQHKAIFEKVNQLLAASAKGTNRTEVLAMLDFLANYAVTHFGCEEELMAKRCSAEICAANKAAHQKFVVAFTALSKRVATEGVTLPLAFELQSKVSDWLIAHIMKIDTKLRGTQRKP